ncbi:hypothetical protein BT69DRAFT_1276761 [Atractiella rhizophila]|nr:hypothetical protein BT69DRAFT_1283765 [Atractiella rhizophila]KAH8928836.1 hypothetical protein BT69DRAFT_1276761 [Atractiella rhizophila]
MKRSEILCPGVSGRFCSRRPIFSCSAIIFATLGFCSLLRKGSASQDSKKRSRRDAFYRFLVF